MPLAGSFATPLDHPSLPGHFPGNPVAPGVVVLEQALRLAAQALGWGHPVQITAVKFTRPVLPGEPVEVFYSQVASCRAEIECCVAGMVVLRGTAQFAGQ